MFELDRYQEEAVARMHNGCVLAGAVGAGKSITALAYFWTKVVEGDLGDRESARKPRDLYVITTAKKRDSLDWEEEAVKMGLSTHIGAGLQEIDFTVDSWNKMSSYEDVEAAFFIFDEQKLVGKGAWVKSFLKIAKRNQWILLSATPGDTWMDYVPVFLANGFYKHRTEFLREHVNYAPWSRYPKILSYNQVGRLERNKASVLVPMSYKTAAVRHEHKIKVEFDHQLFERVLKERWHVYEERPLKDASELFRVMRQVVNTDTSRVGALQDLLRQHPKVIVFYNFNYELEMLRGSIPASTEQSSPSESSTSGVQIAEWNGHKHEPVPTSDSWLYLVQYSAGSEGWNCVETDTMVFYSLPYSYKLWAQSRGRIDRKNSPFSDLHYYSFVSDSKIDRIIWKTLAEKRTFQEKNVSHFFAFPENRIND